MVLARRRDSLARTSGAGGVAKEACGAAHGAPVWVRLQPGKRRGLYYFDNRLRKFFFYFSIRTNKADKGKIKPVPRTDHRAQSLPPSPRASGPRRPAPTFLPPAACRTSRRSSGRRRQSGTEPHTSSLCKRAGTRVRPQTDTPRPPQRGPTASQSFPPRWLRWR